MPTHAKRINQGTVSKSRCIDIASGLIPELKFQKTSLLLIQPSMLPGSPPWRPGDASGLVVALPGMDCHFDDLTKSALFVVKDHDIPE
jgi:hypothetical protein